MLYFVLLLIISFWLGAFPTAWLITKWVMKTDIRQHGSGNVGATNVFRVAGAKWGSLVLGIDVLKGFIPVFFLAPYFYGKAPLLPWYFVYALLAGFAAIAGHNWSPFMGFRGGKGVATSLGVALGLFSKAAAVTLLVFALVLLASGYISVSSMAAAVSFPAAVFLFYRSYPGFALLWGLSVCLSLLIVYTHRGNIQRLLAGNENRIWKKK